MTPGTYIRLRREAKDLSLDDLALKLATNLGVSALDRAEHLRLVEADVAVIGADLVGALQGLCKAGEFAFSRFVLWELICRHAGADIPEPNVCQLCGCSWMDPCLDAHHQACAWSDEPADLCTVCAAAAIPAAGADATVQAAQPGRLRSFLGLPGVMAHRLPRTVNG